MRSTGVSAIVFDLDGTLVDSLEDISAAVNHALISCGRARVPTHQVRAWIGDGLPTLCRRAAEGADETTMQRVIALARGYYSSHVVEFTLVYPNILQMLKLLREAGVSMGVLSNKPHELSLEVVKRLGLSEMFRVVQGYMREEEKKPVPTAALRMVREFGVLPGAAAMIGDSGIDVEMAKRAGMIAGAVTWGFRDRAELESVDPDVMFDDPMEICRYMGLED